MRCIFAFALLQWCFGVNPLLGQSAILEGYVLDQESKQPIEFANISIINMPQGTSSGSNGSFRITNLKEGALDFSVSCIGYQTLTVPIQIRKGRNTVSFELETAVENLSPIVITGTGTQHKIDNVPVQTEIISGKTIQAVSGRSVEEVIAGISSSVDFTASSMGSNIKINGLGKGYVLILVNGKRLTGDIGGRIDLSRINTEDIEQIEIVKGASSTLYGSDAIAGVINIITRKSERKFNFTNSTRLGAYNDWKQLNTLTFNVGRFSGKTSFTRKQTDGWQLNDLKYNTKWKKNNNLPFLVKTYEMPVNKKHSYTVKHSLTYNVLERLSLDLEASWHEKTLYFPFKGRMHNYYYNDISTSIGGKYAFENQNYITFNSDYGNYKYYTEYPYKRNERYATKEGTVSRTYYPGDRFKNSDQINWITQVKGVFHMNEKHTLSIGTEYLSEFLEAKYRLSEHNVSAYTLSVYAQDEFKLGEDVDLVAGVRLIHHQTFGVIATPKISAMYKKSRLTYRASYSKGFKAPTLKELYYYYESERMGMYRLYLGNKDLKPQKSDYYAVSTEYKHHKFRTSLSVYLNEVHDMIDYKIIPTQWDDARRGVEETKFRYNINEARTIGCDFLVHASLFSGFALGGGYSYVDAQNLTQTIQLDGISKHSATLKAAWSKKWKVYDLKLNLMGSYKSEKFYLEEDLNRSTAKPYQLWKLTSSHTINKFKKTKLVFIAGIDNVFDYVDDSPYGSHYGTLNPGRSLFVGVNINFNK